MLIKNKFNVLVALFFCLIASGCTTLPPSNTDNICAIFDQKKGWYKDARKASKKWGSSIPVMMAFMHQESRFRAKAKPPRRKILWIFPGPRLSSAYGYSQVKDGTWKDYRKKSGNGWASRDNFDDAIDFVGWYNHVSYKRSKIKKNDTYHLYLAYHEGHGGFNRRSFKNKSTLKGIARKVASRASRYQSQLVGCEKRFQGSWWWPFS